MEKHIKWIQTIWIPQQINIHGFLYGIFAKNYEKNDGEQDKK